MPSFWYSPGLASRPVIGSTTPMVISEVLVLLLSPHPSGSIAAAHSATQQRTAIDLCAEARFPFLLMALPQKTSRASLSPGWPNRDWPDASPCFSATPPLARRARTTDVPDSPKPASSGQGFGCRDYRILPCQQDCFCGSAAWQR